MLVHFVRTHQHTANILHLYFFFTQEFKFCVLSSSARAVKLNTVCPVSVKLQRKNGPFPALSVMSHVTCVTPGSPTYEVALVFVLLGCFA